MQDVALFGAMGWNLNADILTQLGYQNFTSHILRDSLDFAAVPEPASLARFAGRCLVTPRERRAQH